MLLIRNIRSVAVAAGPAPFRIFVKLPKGRLIHVNFHNEDHDDFCNVELYSPTGHEAEPFNYAVLMHNFVSKVPLGQKILTIEVVAPGNVVYDTVAATLRTIGIIQLDINVDEGCGLQGTAQFAQAGDHISLTYMIEVEKK